MIVEQKSLQVKKKIAEEKIVETRLSKQIMREIEMHLYLT